MREVFVQCKAKPAKPCGSLELDQVRLADELDSESRRKGDVRLQLFSQTVDLKQELLQCKDSGNETEKEEAQQALERIQVCVGGGREI